MIDANVEVLNIDYNIENVRTEVRERLRSEDGTNYSRVGIQLEFTIYKGRVGVELYFEDRNWLHVLGELRGVHQSPARRILGRVSARLLDMANISI